MRQPAFLHIFENKGADQQRGNSASDQRFCFRYMDSLMPLHPKIKCEISSLWQSSVAVLSGLCLTWLETPKTGFLATRLS